MRKLKAASVDDIAALPGFGRRTAAAVLTALNGGGPNGGGLNGGGLNAGGLDAGGLNGSGADGVPTR